MDPCVAVDIFNQALVHEEHLRSAADIRVDGHREHGVVIFTIDPVELITPYLLDVAGVHKAVAVGRLLDKHHRREVVEVPVGRDLDERGLLTAHQRFHPLGRGSGVVNLRPAVTDAHVVRVEVVMHKAMVVREAMS